MAIKPGYLNHFVFKIDKKKTQNRLKPYFVYRNGFVIKKINCFDNIFSHSVRKTCTKYFYYFFRNRNPWRWGGGGGSDFPADPINHQRTGGDNPVS